MNIIVCRAFWIKASNKTGNYNENSKSKYIFCISYLICITHRDNGRYWSEFFDSKLLLFQHQNRFHFGMTNGS